MKIFKYIFALAAGVALWGCSEEDFSVYKPGSKAGIYIQCTNTTDISGNILSFNDSITRSFASVRADQTEVSVPVLVKVMGDVVNYDRPFKFVVVDSLSSAVRGTHFDFADSLCYIPAGKAQQYVQVKLFRHPDILSKTLRAVVAVQANEHFTLEMEHFKSTAQWNATGNTLTGHQYKIIFNEKYDMPSYWGTFGEDYWGKWSALKEQRVNAVMGWTHTDWNNAGFSGAKIALGKFAYAARKLREQLQAAADEGNPVYDEDGKFMQLADLYAVDYSKYYSDPQ